jgi:hypothetical protein
MTSYVIGIKSRYEAVFSSFCVLIATGKTSGELELGGKQEVVGDGGGVRVSP